MCALGLTLMWPWRFLVPVSWEIHINQRQNAKLQWGDIKTKKLSLLRNSWRRILFRVVHEDPFEPVQVLPLKGEPTSAMNPGKWENRGTKRQVKMRGARGQWCQEIKHRHKGGRDSPSAGDGVGIVENLLAHSQGVLCLSTHELSQFPPHSWTSIMVKRLSKGHGAPVRWLHFTLTSTVLLLSPTKY